MFSYSQAHAAGRPSGGYSLAEANWPEFVQRDFVDVTSRSLLQLNSASEVCESIAGRRLLPAGVPATDEFQLWRAVWRVAQSCGLEDWRRTATERIRELRNSDTYRAAVDFWIRVEPSFKP